jgi:hypothetical protein
MNIIYIAAHCCVYGVCMGRGGRGMKVIKTSNSEIRKKLIIRYR